MAGQYLVFGFVFLCLFSFSAQNDQSSKTADVQVENEDGTKQVFKGNRLEPMKGESCVLCAQKAVNSEPRLTTLRSNVVLTVGEAASVCDGDSTDLPTGLCSYIQDEGYCSKDKSLSCNHSPEELAEEIVDRLLVPMATGNDDIDTKLALGIVLMNLGHLDDALDQFTSLIKSKPNIMGAYYGRGVVYSRKGLQDPVNAARALSDFTKSIEKSTDQNEPYARRAEVYLSLGQYHKALLDLNKAASLRPTDKIYFLRGILHLLLENFKDAETDFKRNLDVESPLYLTSYFHLGLAQYYRGKVRNAIEVFKEVLKIQPKNVEATTSLAQAFRELGNLRAARNKFNHSLALSPRHPFTLHLQGNMFYYSGEPAKAVHDFNKCLEADPGNINCQYMQALSYVSMGKFYEGVKSSTKVMVKNLPELSASPEFVKAHYLREYARYLHAHLDSPVSNLKLDEELNSEFKDHWAKLLPFKFTKEYKEQSGLQPSIRDVNQLVLTDYPQNVQNLICKADKIGWLMQVNSDGYTANKRLNLAMGIAAIHISQKLEARWKALRQNKQMERSLIWREIFNIAVQYRRLVDPEQPVLWLDKMPDFNTADGYRTDISFKKGPVQNIKVLNYFNLAFQLAKTMLKQYIGPGDDIDKAKTCEELLNVAKKRKINQHGFVVSTQVPSSRKNNEKDRLPGAMIILSEDSVVAYSVAIGLIMSVGRQVTGKIPNGKLLEMEALLSGAPDAFILVTKQWMNIKRLNVPTSTLPKVWETFPTVRSVLEVLSVNTESCS
ncbi:hypothetical protein KUTeg_013366 [Tegillarca granosa]|uniref:Tetratricopeptide repeat protein 13 n=1 Tax=Tegillarca granosa TaxID=220873 RepID=A0ABQ9EWY1_TEGGR|nr:hypothetical protein KUTeg_013366 [Tegillarca granosa]